LYQHFLTIAQEVDLPMILYNIPGRCGVNLEPRTIVKLAEIENIVGIKEASGQLDQVSQIALSTSLTILSGDDSLTLPIASVGGKGVISVVANIVPTDVKALTDAILEGDFATARQWHNKLFTLASTMLGLATNPIPIKTAMGLLHMSSPQMRLPMVGLSDSKIQILEQVLTEYGLIN
jgi:4-hydroxy-tetrahydrodipicolinate synthase